MALSFDDEGLSTQTQEEIAQELGDRLRETFGPNLKTEIRSIMGQIINILSELRAIDQQALLAVYRSFDPAGAIGAALDARCSLTGTVRQGATSSTVDGDLTFTAIGTINNGDLIRNDDNDTLWELISGPHTSTGAEVIPATFRAVDTGPILANAGTTWSAVTVIANLTGFSNPIDDAEVGRDQETDADLRRRRLVELYSQGQGPLATIKAVVSRVAGVVNARVYHNPSIYPADGDGIPFKAFNVVVETLPAVPTAAMQQAIWNAIWSATGGGGEAYGTDYVGTIVDSEGVEQPSAFDVVLVRDIQLEIDLVTSTSEDPVTQNIEDVVAAQVIATAQADYERVGRDVKRVDFQGIVQAMLAAGTISGVDDVVVRMSFAPATPTAVAKLAVGIRDKADFDSGSIVVVQT